MRQGGLRLRTGPVVSSVESPLPAVARGIALHYAQHLVESAEVFADFQVRVDRPRGLQGWLGRQVAFEFDGRRPLAAMPGDQGFALLECGLDWCIASHCHQYLIVHAAALERGGRALLLPAPAGSGKSTLCAALVRCGGWRLLSDELALIDPASGHVVPLPRPVRLKGASIDALQALVGAQGFVEVAHDNAQGRVACVRPPIEAVLRAHETAVPAWIVVPRYLDGADVQWQAQSRARGFMALVNNAFNYNVHGRSGFDTLAQLVGLCECGELTYSDLAGAVAVCGQLVDFAL